MSTPANTRCYQVLARYGGKVHLYVSDYEIHLQLRREIATVDSIEEPSFKVAVELSPAQASELAFQLLSASKIVRV